MSNRKGDILYNILDQYTGEQVTYKKVTTFADGTAMSDGKCDGVVYRKAGSEYFKREVTGAVNPLWFNAKGDGTDETVALSKLFAGAKLLKKPIRLETGKTYKYTPAATTDVTGIPAIEGNAVIDCSGVTSDITVFQVTGTKTLLQTGVAVTANGYSLQLAAGLFLKPGQTLFIASGEAYPNAYRTHYFKGQRVTIESYSSVTGIVKVYEPSQYSITAAYVYLNDYQPHFKLGAGIRLIGNTANLMSGVIGKYASIDVQGEFYDFAMCAVGAYSSLLYGRYAAYNSYKAGSGNSYGCSVADFSQVYLNQCDIKGGRHAVSLGGGSEYQSIFGGSGGAPAAYPCNAQINGGTYAASEDSANPSIDGHGIANSLTISDATLYGCLTYSGAKLSTYNTTIHYWKGNGFEPNIESVNADFGDYEFHNTTFNAINTIANSFCGFRINNTVRSIALNNVTINDKPPGSGVNAILIDVPPTYLTIDGLTINTTATASEPTIKFKNNNTLFRNITVNGVGMKFEPTVTGLDFVCDNFTGKGGTTGLQVYAYSKRLKDVVIRNATIRGYKQMGIWIGGTDKLTIQNSFCNNNGVDTTASAGLRSGLFLDYCGTVILQNNDLSSTNSLQQYAVFHKTETAVAYGWSGNNIAGNVQATPYQFFGTQLYQLNNQHTAALPSVLPNALTVSQVKLSALNTAPASATDTGAAGDIRITAGFVYVCTAANTWVRAALATW